MDFLSIIVNSLNNRVNFLNDILWSKYGLIPLLLGTGLFFTLRTGFVQLTLFPEMIRSITKSASESSDDKKSISSFEAFAVGLASRVGTGNLAGVAIAIVLGGPGAVFWMWIVAIFGSASAFIESTLAQLYKVKADELHFKGGPAYYMRDGLKLESMGVAFAFSISIAFGLVFNAVQANTIAHATMNTLHADVNQKLVNVIIGLVLVAITGIILFSGAKKIADVTTKLVPVMSILYIGIAIVVIVMRINMIPQVFSMIIKDAFDFNSAIGGAIGVTIINGVKRGLFSNEAGMGSAPNAAASATTDHPVRQGLIQSFGVYIDTIVVCSATAFIILASGIEIDPNATDGITVTMDALSSVVGNWANYFIFVAILLFAYSSILGNYFYAQSNVEYLSSNSKFVPIFKVFVLCMVFFGSVASSKLVWDFADVSMAIMAILNVIAILVLHKHAIYLLKDFNEQREKGLNPVFDSSKHEAYKHFELWDKSK